MYYFLAFIHVQLMRRVLIFRCRRLGGAAEACDQQLAYFNCHQVLTIHREVGWKHFVTKLLELCIKGIARYELLTPFDVVLCSILEYINYRQEKTFSC